jgi:NAD(P)-dependent dehydrogenase (short-subunit alcohol dehydrogenase family)
VFDLSNQHTLVTDGSSGAGRHFARFLASNGAHVTLAARRAEALVTLDPRCHDLRMARRSPSV